MDLALGTQESSLIVSIKTTVLLIPLCPTSQLLFLQSDGQKHCSVAAMPEELFILSLGIALTNFSAFQNIKKSLKATCNYTDRETERGFPL